MQTGLEQGFPVIRGSPPLERSRVVEALKSKRAARDERPAVRLRQGGGQDGLRQPLPSELTTRQSTHEIRRARSFGKYPHHPRLVPEIPANPLKWPKQWGGVQKSKDGREPNDQTWDEFPNPRRVCP